MSDEAESPAAHDLLERAAVECLGTATDATFGLSAAISLRRIADSLEVLARPPLVFDSGKLSPVDLELLVRAGPVGGIRVVGDES
jgi:hypothetical protein